MIEARDLFVEDDARPPFFSMEDVDIYSGKAFSSIYYLLLESLATSEAGEVKGHARHAVNQVSTDISLNSCKVGRGFRYNIIVARESPWCRGRALAL